MKGKILCIFIIALLISVVPPVTGHEKEIFKSKNNNYTLDIKKEIDPFLNDVSWMRTYGDKGIDSGYSVLQTDDDGYIVAGKSETSDSTSYGFIVTLINHNNDYYRNEVNSKIRHLINDLLREKILIYWTAEDITINVKKILNGEISDQESELFFEKGSFIIPFPGEDEQDTKISAIIFDYNESSEIENKKLFKVPVFIIVNQMEVNSYLLTEVKIAQYVNFMIYMDILYLRIAEDCGFFTYDYIADEAVDKNLRKSNYNVMFWAGGTPLPFIPTVIDLLQEELKRNSTTSAIRRFVNNGGGYIGSCYGAYVASYCMLPLPAYYVKQAYNPELRTFGITAISDVITRMTRYTMKEVEATIRLINESHPVTYGLDPLVLCKFYFGGPKIVKVGKNSEVIGLYQDGALVLKNSPTWVSSKFGKGRVVIFTTHPEIFVLDLDRNEFKNDVISNALFYTTFKEKLIFQTSQSRNQSFILEIWEKTEDMSNYLDKKESIFDEIRTKINETLDIMKLFYLNHSSNMYNFYYYYLNDSLGGLTLIEKIYPLFYDDSDFKDNLSIFKDEIFKNVNLTISKFKNFIEFINLSQKPIAPPFIIIKFLIIRYIYRNAYYTFRKCFMDIPKIYFNTQKFLRHYWYEFEIEIAI